MRWKVDKGTDVTSTFKGITAPPRELFDEIHGRGWEVTKVDINKDGLVEATVRNPYGDKLSKNGPDEATALGHCLVAIMRTETMRYLPHTAAWQNTWEQQLPEIAKAYAEAPSYDPKAAGAWKELGEDSVRRAEAINNQINVEFTHDPWPYQDVNEMAKDIRDKQHVLVSKANLSHPLWSSEQALAYRLTHDVLGHAAVGGDWGWHGENGATAAHMPLLSPEAQRALFTEAIGQSAHNSFYGQIGPQKITFLDDQLKKVQDKENSAGHSGLHPSQSIVPTGIPGIEQQEEGQSKTSKAEDGKDPNHEWESNVEPLPDNAHLWQKEEDGKDPLDAQGLKDMAYKLDPHWFELQDHNGVPDLASQKQAVANAFRSALISPRKTPRWAATHYQHIQHIPADVSDPLRFTDALDAQREAHNQARGLPVDIHRQEWAPLITSLSQWLKTAHPKLDDTQIREAARRELFHMIVEEEQRITADDPGGDLHPMQISEGVNKALRKRLSLATKPRVDQKFDFGKDRLFHKGFVAPDPGSYGDYVTSHIRPIAGVGLHISDLARAAREDVAQHGGKGHHFRAQASDLIPGVGPREISEAWHRLQPHSSQLAVINPSIQEALGYDRSEPLPTRDYFKAERQLAAARDAAGYTNVPLGQFSQGVSDNMNYGHPVHTDLSPFKAVNPVPAEQVDWSQYPNLPTQDWSEPYWWKSTQPARDEVGKDWDQGVAVNNPAEKIPYRTAAGPQYYIHSTNHPFQPEDIIEPASAIGHQAPNAEVSPGYDPNSVYMWDLNAMNDPNSEYYFPQSDNKYHYLVEPLGEVRPDPEKAGLEQFGDEQPEWYHDYYHVAPQARVIERFDDWNDVLDAADHMNKFSKKAEYVPAPEPIEPMPSTVPYIVHPVTGEHVEGHPQHSIMQHAKNTLGMNTEEIWAADPEVGRMPAPANVM